MVQSTDFTPEEWKLVYNAPIYVATFSSMIGPISILKSMTVAFTLILIINDTSKQFPENTCIQEIIATMRKSKYDAERTSLHERNYKQTLDGQPLRGKESAIPERNEWSERAINILSQKSQPQELKEYKQWLLLIARGVMEKVRSHGFLGLRKKKTELELAQVIQDFAQVLQISE